MKFRVIAHTLDNNMKPIENSKKVYDIGEFKDINEAYTNVLHGVLCNAPNGATNDKENHEISFLNGVNMVTWKVEEDI